MILGFGYGDRINDYKVVRITYFHDEYEGYLGGLECEVEVYSLSTNTRRPVAVENGCELSNLFDSLFHWKFALDIDRCR